jgi:glycosyltransferase involved in cell wall biosynthesis
MSIRVAHIIPTDRIAYLMRTRLLRLQEAGIEQRILCGDTGYLDHLRQCGLEPVAVPFAREIEPWTDLRCVLALRRELRRGGYDIAHSHNPKGTLLGPPTAQLAGVPLAVHTVYGFLFNENSSGLHRLAAKAAERWCAMWCDQLLFQCREDYDYAQARRYKGGKRLHWIGSGIDERRFDRDLYPAAGGEIRRQLGIGNDELVVGMVGRFVEEKGWIEFCRMAGRVAQKEERARFLAVGINEKKDQSDAVDVSALLKENGVADRSVVLVDRQDMPELYSCMDLAVLPSYREGIPRALLEAGAMGVPMAASDIRGCREVITHAETGMLFGLKNTDGFSRIVLELLGDERGRRELGERGRRHILENYTATLANQRLVDCYKRFMAARN